MTNEKMLVEFRKKNQDELLEVWIPSCLEREDFDKLIQFVDKAHPIKIVEIKDMHIACIGTIEVSGHMVKLMFDDLFGTTFFATTRESEGTVRQIGNNLEEWVHNIG